MDLTTIDPTLGAAMVNMGSVLSSLVLKGTATAIQILQQTEDRNRDNLSLNLIEYR